MASIKSHIQIARSLPLQLQNFFLRHPPIINIAEPSTSTTILSSSPQQPQTPSQSPAQFSSERPNPFLPHKNPDTGRWRPPVYSLRKQADLISLATKHNCLTLLPWSPKLSGTVQKRTEDEGIRVKGTGVGQRVKGKLWERTQKGRLEARRQAMEGMDELVKQWKLRGHGRGWKKWPKKGGLG